MLASSRRGALAYLLAFGLAGLVASFGLIACGTDAVGVESCRKLENVRCEKAPECGISLEKPPHEGSPDEDVTACKRYYKDACLHGLPSGKDPGELEVEACAEAIRTGSCDVVRVPSSTPACAFLLEQPAVEDAGSDADLDASSADAGTSNGAFDAIGDASPF